MSILKEWYNGNICPIEEIVPHSTEYHSLIAEIGAEREYFTTRMPADDRERFTKWNNLISEYEEMTEYGNFSYGFKLGAKLAFEIFAKEEDELRV